MPKGYSPQEALQTVYNLGYRVNSAGNVVSFTGRILSPCLKRQSDGYIRAAVTLWVPPKEKGQGRVSVHIAVSRLAAIQKFGAEALFASGIEVRHLDNNSLNNHLENIGIGTHSENMLDIPEDRRKTSSLFGVAMAAKKRQKFSDDVEREIREKSRSGISYQKLMQEYGISSKGTLSYIVNKKPPKPNQKGSTLTRKDDGGVL